MSVDRASLLPWIALASVPALSGADFRRLLAAFGSPARIVASPQHELARLVDARTAEAIRRSPESPAAQAGLGWVAEPDRAIVTLADERYPALLRETPDPPPVLYAWGSMQLLARTAFAIVGSRNASAQGMRNAEAFARSLSAHGLCIVSGMALGIDTAAHRGALQEAGRSIAVLGCGIDAVYPKRNAALLHELCTHGLVLSEFALGTPPLAHNFPRRNRIIAGLGRGCLVVEAALASGSLVTARAAVDMGRDVFAIPGSIHSPLSKGCHHLIKQGAKLVEDASDVLDELGLPVHRVEPTKASATLTPEAERVVAALGHDPCGFDALVARTGLAVDRLAALLAQLELDARVERNDAGLYQRLD
jgi:DNA processing protein